tara:strand:+ start:314 stop:970 length:657 start_codon:yes stop_codon:yes gene_type:complete
MEIEKEDMTQMNNTNLFYGNLTIEQEEEANSMFAEMQRVSDYFKGHQFIFPNEDETYMEIMKLYKLVDENFSNPDKVFQAQDIDLNKYLLSASKNLGLSASESTSLIDNLHDTINPLILDLKRYWNRARPFQYAYYFDVDFNPMKTISGHSPSYPSGHTLYAACWKKVVDNKMPEASADTQNILDTVNQGRMSIGAHFPSDIAFSVEISEYLNDNRLL